ncbi:uncharacterized protein LOC106760315 [Vigna radiata var. radiata]|uniref:RNA-directed DNA polymerase n=1 Tax=Vigna radiata var. radiata TaxID=3916 RepID=A0A1S3TZR3_VIGRR|nr:uncharacterized protein LOC106760315 [Vigna radiata var. radiata]
MPPGVAKEDSLAGTAPRTTVIGGIDSLIGAKNKLEILEERLRAIKGIESLGFNDVARLSLVPGIKIPHKFKAPEFEKYQGNTCPKSYLTMYCRKMAAYAYDDKLLIHFFQDSLVGVALNWYTHLESSRIRCWVDLADAFVKQYKYNMHVAPDRLPLQNMTKKDNETFKEYAQRWRELPVQVEPPLYDKEMVAMFVNTLQPPFYEHMVGNVSSNFADIVIIGERIEIGLKNGKIGGSPSAIANSKKPNFNPGKRKEGDVHAASAMPVWRGQAPIHNYRPYMGPPPYAANAAFAHPIRPQQPQQGFYQPQPITNNAWRAGTSANPNPNACQSAYLRKTQERNFVHFTPIPTTYTESLPHLVKKGLVAICLMMPMQPPYPRGYDVDAKCSYHGGGVGHSTERCMDFKHKVQALIDAGWLKFQEDKPSIDANPLSGHGGASTNAIEVKKGELIRGAGEIRSSRRFIFKKLLKLGFLNGEYDLGKACGLHPCAGHSIDEYVEFEKILQDLLDRNLMQVYCEDKKEEVFAQTGGEPDVALPEPLVIRFTRTTPTPAIQGGTSVVIHTPSSFPYKSEKVVPWRYGTHAIDEGQRTESQSFRREPAIENISGIGGMTRSGRIFTPPNLMKEGTSNNEAPAVDTPDTESKKEISEEEACEFLKFIQQSEYKVVEQLNRMPARISLLELLMHSTSHRKLLMKILSEAHVEQGIFLNKFEGIVSNITANNYLTFTEEEIPTEGRGHNKALHVSVKCLDHVIARVLINNGSSLNVMPKTTLEKLPCDGMHMKPSSLIVRAFDGSKREVMGEIELPVQVGPCVFQITFQVMDILPAYSCLLGRPWIHSAGVVPSTLHQKLKYVMGDKLVIVSGEEDLLVSGPSSARYIEAAEESLETAFQSLEIVGNAYVESFPVNPHLSSASIMVAKVMLKEGYKYGSGLGKYGQGRTFPLKVVENKGRYGLGYKPSKEDKKMLIEEKRERSLARVERREPRARKIRICDIKESFRSAGWVNASQIAVVQDEAGSESSDFVWACSPDVQLNNWKTLDLPVMFNSNKTYDNECFENNNVEIPNFEHPVDNTEDDYEDGSEPSPELMRLVEQESKEIKPHQEEVEILNLGEEDEIKEVNIGTTMKEEVRERLRVLLREFKDVFAWSYNDMPCLDTDIVEHKLPLKPECLPVKQKLRRMKPEMSLKIKEEVQKQFDAGFLAVAKYPQWVANIVPVPKKDGKVRMCVDYRDLNRASPKDNFPLPHIDTLVDNTAKFSLFSFMDGFSGYNQIKMAPEDMEKTTFITLWGTFCYKVMSFGLKNAGATYQRAMVALFHDMMHKEIEVYVDDMIAKSESKEEHILNLRKLFERLRKFKLRLNLAKCTFGVKSGKLLGFIVSQRGIEVDPDKVRAIVEMPVPRKEKEVRGFLGRLNYITRFISQLTATCEPMFKLLRKNQAVVWNEDCQAAFEKIKQYLQDPPVLRPPEPGRPLILYLTVLDDSMGCVLGQHDEVEKKEHAIYYLSKKFTDCERQYSLLERTCCALAWAAHRLRQYMLSHSTWLISRMDPIKYIFEKPALTGRIARWQMLLSEYDIIYITQKSVKGSALAEYLAHQPLSDYQPMQPEFPDEDIMALFEENRKERHEEAWTLLFDGASNVMGHGVGVVLITPGKQYIPMTARLCFNCTNNIAEYEACAMGIRAAIESKAKILDVYGDSALVIHQLKGEWETRDAKLIPYQAYIRGLMEYFDVITFNHIPREDNQLADALATLSSMFEVDQDAELPLMEKYHFGGLVSFPVARTFISHVRGPSHLSSFRFPGVFFPKRDLLVARRSLSRVSIKFNPLFLFFFEFLSYFRCVFSLEGAWEGEANVSSYNITEETDPEKLIPRGTRLTVHLKATRVILATDGDSPGQVVAEELARHIGKEKCWRVRWPKNGRLDNCKDANEPAYCLFIEEEIDGKPWYFDIKQYLKTREYPEKASENDKRSLRRLAGSFILNGDVLYKRNHDMVLLRCVDAKEAELILREVHEGAFGTHMNRHSMARKILRAGYFWLIMENDCCTHVRKCEKCQMYADNINVPLTTLNVLSAPWPFSMWGIDVIGAIEPKASNGHRFILVAIDYFTKWVEAASYANVTRKVVTKFIKRELICRYGLPNKIITDNATNLNNQMMIELCEEFKIHHLNSSPYRPKMNGAVKATNKNIKKIVQKMVVTYKDFHEMLPFALHGYRTSVRTSTGATPFSLVYGMEAVLPFEVEIPSLRVLMETQLEEAEWVQAWLDQLNLIEEKRLTAVCHGQLYQRRMKKAFDKKVRPREFHGGELVLKKILPIQKDHKGKWTPNYEGLFVVKKAFSGGALILTRMDGEELPLPVNSDAVKKFYA